MIRQRQKVHRNCGRSLFVLTLLGVASVVCAGDEDMSPSAYHVFDPETGYMVTVDPLDEEQQEPTSSDLPTSEDEVDAMAETAGEHEQATVTAQTWTFIVVGIIAVAAVFVWIQYKKRPS